MPDVLIPEVLTPQVVRQVRRGTASARPAQRWFASTLARTAVLTGGYRSGKTVAAVMRCYRFGQMHYPHPVLVMEPKWRMVVDVFVETALRMCHQWKLRAKYRDSAKKIEIGPIYHPSTGIFRSNDAGRDAAEGITVGSGIFDEWELFDVDVLKAAFARISIGPDHTQCVGLCGTAEGFGPGYAFVLESHGPDTEQRIARSSDNTALRPGYVDDMASRLSEAEAAEKLDGIRTPAGGVVYTKFRRGLHDKLVCAQLSEVGRGNVTLELWADFNTAIMAWAIVVVDKGQRCAHVCGELVHFDTNTADQCDRATAALADLLKCSRHAVRDKKIRIVCDASSDHRGGVVALSHVALLRERGFVPQYGNHNPAVEDRVATVQAMLGGQLPSGRSDPVRLTIDRERAPYMTMCLEQQPKLANGEPSKSPTAGSFARKPVGLDHGADAVGYGCFWHFPTWRPAPNREEEQKAERYRRAGYAIPLR